MLLLLVGAQGGCESGASSGSDPEDGSEVEYVDYRDLTAASCLDTCATANDGQCDEPFLCVIGSDCSDCGGTLSAPTLDENECVDTCRYANDGECDVPYLCPTGTDCADCGGRGESCDDSCEYALDGECDAPFACARGTDCSDCHGPQNASMRRVAIVLGDASCTDATLYVNGGRWGAIEAVADASPADCVQAVSSTGYSAAYDLLAGVGAVFEVRGSCNYSVEQAPLEAGSCAVVCLGCP